MFPVIVDLTLNELSVPRWHQLCSGQSVAGVVMLRDSGVTVQYL